MHAGMRAYDTEYGPKRMNTLTQRDGLRPRPTAARMWWSGG